MYAFFVDFKAAFDSVNRNALTFKLLSIGVSHKFVNVINTLYTDTCSFVKCGRNSSEIFEIKSGVKQGCNLSPILFSLFLDDLHSSLVGGIECMGMVLKVLLYADDLVILADSQEKMQRMINRFYDYCVKWKLTVNLNKSKIMIFRAGGGSYARNEKWNFNTEQIEVVKEYKYLGVWITSNLKFNIHLKKKANEAKAAIATTWGSLISKPEVTVAAKHKIFQSTSMAILFYAAQVWGVKKYEEVEGVLRYYLKRLYKLPLTTPNYMFYLEFGISDLFLTTFKLHLDYIIKSLSMKQSRIPKVISQFAIRTRSLWFTDWIELSQSVNMEITFDPNNLTNMRTVMIEVLNNIHYKNITHAKETAKTSVHREIYSALNHDILQLQLSYINMPPSSVSLLFKARGELLPLNFIPHRNDLQIYCSLCNLNTRENTSHFIGKCPILVEIRIKHFKSNYLSENEVRELLDGKCWLKLSNYLAEALNYRSKIIEELF